MGSHQVATAAAGAIAATAGALLSALDADQKSRASFEFDSQERQNWHFIPRARQGLPRRDMSGAQIDAADALMAAGLSEEGFRKARAIIEHEAVLRRVEDDEGVRRFPRDPGLYFYSVFGAPGEEGPWGWRVEGHHLSLNYTVVGGGAATPTPSFFGANPAEVKSGPEKGLRILRDEEDLARELYVGLDPQQRELALVYPVAPAEIITRASPRVGIDSRIGLPAEHMTADQKAKLMSLIEVYIGRKTDELAQTARRKLQQEGINGVHFGWAGGPHRGQPHYYRLHGPSFVVEYDNTQNMANHVHAVWRDVEGDFGFDALQEHYRHHHA
jgi:hypothetical protein